MSYHFISPSYYVEDPNEFIDKRLSIDMSLEKLMSPFDKTKENSYINILNYLKITVLCIYHGSSLDLLKMPFDKIWLFDHNNHNTKVTEANFTEYKRNLSGEIRNYLESS